MFRIPLWIKLILAIVLIAAVACFAIFIIATAKDLTFVEYVKSWFQTTNETINPTVGEAISGTIMGSTF